MYYVTIGFLQALVAVLLEFFIKIFLYVCCRTFSWRMHEYECSKRVGSAPHYILKNDVINTITVTRLINLLLILILMDKKGQKFSGWGRLLEHTKEDDAESCLI